MSTTFVTLSPPPVPTNDEKENSFNIGYNHPFFSDEQLTSSEYDDGDNSNADEFYDQQDHEWDILIFTQEWPVTTCYHWREEDKTHDCSLPPKKEFWTIHGIWPTKLGHFGPNFCNNSAKFDFDQLEQIMDKLLQYWPDIHSHTTIYNDLWKHEWVKHGTCAALLDKLDSELKYFTQGVAWREDYKISNILGAAGIHPDSNNTVIALQTALLNGLSKNPSIHCIYDDKTDVSYLSEIRICFNKTLQLTDCDGVKRGDAVSIDYPGGTVNTNCHISKLVHYPSMVPPVQRKKYERKWKFPVVNLYKLLQFVMWFTL